MLGFVSMSSLGISIIVPSLLGIPCMERSGARLGAPRISCIYFRFWACLEAASRLDLSVAVDTILFTFQTGYLAVLTMDLIQTQPLKRASSSFFPPTVNGYISLSNIRSPKLHFISQSFAEVSQTIRHVSTEVHAYGTI